MCAIERSVILSIFDDNDEKAMHIMDNYVGTLSHLDTAQSTDERGVQLGRN